MPKAMSGYGLGIGLLTLSGLLLNYGGLETASTNQFNIFIVLLKTYTPLLTPVSSLLGLPVIGGSQVYGVLPLMIWVGVACIVGVVTRGLGGGAKAMFLAASTILILWIASLFLSAPAWPDYLSWLSAANNMATDLVSRPIDLALILILPTASSALTGELMQLIQSKMVKRAKVEEETYFF
ncbi:MAG: hypothetical protein J7K49_02145 [Thaumarchaeota archaeon]|nr:hypothetical protein [Nitrososphaerota archaeon]